LVLGQKTNGLPFGLRILLPLGKVIHIEKTGGLPQGHFFGVLIRDDSLSEAQASLEP